MQPTYGYPSTITLATLKAVMYRTAAVQGLQSNSGPDEICMQMQSVVNEIERCQALDPPDIVREAQLLNLASNTFSDSWQQLDWYNNGVQ